MRAHGHLSVLLACFLATGIGFADTAGAQTGPLLRAVAVSGDAAPDGDGFFNFFQQPSINDQGDVSFSSTFSLSFNIAAVVVESSKGLEIVARSNDPAPDGNGVLFSFGIGPIPINSNGGVAFTSALSGTSGGFTDTPRIFTTDGLTLRQVVSRGQAAPDQNGSFAGFDSIGIEDNGDASFWAFFEGTSGGAFVDDRGVYRGDGVTDTHPAPLDEIIRAGEGVGGPVTVGNIDQNLASHSDGWIAIRTFLNNTPSPATDSLTVFVDAGVGRSRRVTTGEASPDGNGTIFAFPIPFIAGDGRLATHVTFNNTKGGLSDNMGIVSYDSISPAADTVIVREGDDPGGEGAFTGAFTGALGFASTLVSPNRFVFYGTRNGPGSSLFLARDGGLVEVAREGDPTPGNDGNFGLLRLNQAHVNAAGTVAFFAQVTGQTTLGDGIFRWTELAGLSSIARVGQPLLGSTIQSVFMMNDSNARIAGNSPMNAFGRLTFRVRLDDGREAIIATTGVPEPGRELMGAVAALMLAALRRGRRRAG